jgi:hypothetical protein
MSWRRLTRSEWRALQFASNANYSASLSAIVGIVAADSRARRVPSREVRA